MPTVTLHPPARERLATIRDALPGVLQTPSGLAIVEIQGTVNSTLEGSSSATPVGRLSFPLYNPSTSADDTTWHKRVHLYVGKHQRLTGEVKKLAKPIAVIRRREPEPGLADESGDLEIAEIVYHKLLFAHRPEPVGGAE